MADQEFVHTAPFSMEAEQALLGNLLIDPQSFANVAYLRKEDFYTDTHQEIFDSISEMSKGSQVIDAVTVVEKLVEMGKMSKGEAGKYVKQLADSAALNTNIEAYAKIIHEKSILRQLIDASKSISDSAYNAAGPTDEILNAAENAIHAISDRKYAKEFVQLKDLLQVNIQTVQDLMNNPNQRFGIQTHFEKLDSTLVGMGPGDLIIIGARPGMGKTSFAMNIACNVAKSSSKTVAIFSLEMTAEQLSSRLLSSEGLIPSKAMMTGQLNGEEWQRLADASSALFRTKILINDSSEITVSEMKSKLRKIDDLELVVIDYLQLMHEDKYKDNRVLEIGYITRALKIMAKEFNVPVILCSQLSRGPKETREVRKPALTDLRDSGAIEQDADIVLFIHRKEYYQAGERSTEDNVDHETAEIIISKNRHGQTGKVELEWYGRYFRFITASGLQDDETSE